jgi:succinoglycan biosynthesis protein ExoM
MLSTAHDQPEFSIEDSAVTVCICTFRRTSLLSALRSVANQILPTGLTCRLLVIDNDFSRTAEKLVSDFRAATKISVEYLHAPGQNISIARNAGLVACRTRWLAFIDDDATATPNWLTHLMAIRAGAAAVFGHCQAIYDEKTPTWMRIGDYHSNRVVRRHGVIETGYTSNVLIDMKFVRSYKLEFDKQLGRTGGEDTLFFYAMYQYGGRLAYAVDAVVNEEVSSSRTAIRWVFTRKYRAGQTYAKLQQRYNVRKYRQILLLSPAKIAFCASVAAVLVIRPSLAMWWLMRGVLHLGMLSYRLGGNMHQEY